MNPTKILNNQPNKLENKLIILAVTLYPLLHLTLKGWTNYFIFILFGIAVYHFLKRPNAFQSINSVTPMQWAVVATLSGGFIAILISQLLRQELVLKSYDGPFRMLLAAPIFLLLVKKQINFVQIFQIICPLSLIILFISLTLFPQQMDHWEAAGRFATYFIGPNEFGNAVMLSTLMTIFSINSLGQDATALKLLKFTGIILGLYLEIKSQTRGAWILEPIMLVLWLSIHWKSKSAKELAAYGLITIIAALLAYFFVDFFHARVNSIYHEMRAWFNQTDINTSTGIRFTMWQICWALFKHSPLLGYSDLGYQTTLLLPEFQAQFSKQAIAVLNCCGPHNQMLADTLHSGIFGLFAALARTFIPLIVFVRGLKSTSIEARAASAIGLCYIIGLFFTGLSLESFSLKFMNSYYGLTLACLCASVLCKPAGNTVKVNN